jgi:hypothetical protein
MKSIAVPAGALVLASLLTSCSHAPTATQNAPASGAVAKQQARLSAQAAASAESEDRQQLDSIPPPSKRVYMAIHTRQSWTNPFLIVSKSTVSLSMMYPDDGPGAGGGPGSSFLHPAAARRRVLDLRIADLPEALAAIPENAWPYGRVIAVEEDPNEARQDRVQVRRNVEATMQVLNDLDVVVYEWPVNGVR